MGKEKSLERVEVQGKEKLRGERRNLWRGWRYRERRNCGGKGEIFRDGGGTGKERGEIKS